MWWFALRLGWLIFLMQAAVRLKSVGILFSLAARIQKCIDAYTDEYPITPTLRELQDEFNEIYEAWGLDRRSIKLFA